MKRLLHETIVTRNDCYTKRLLHETIVTRNDCYTTRTCYIRSNSTHIQPNTTTTMSIQAMRCAQYIKDNLRTLATASEGDFTDVSPHFWFSKTEDLEPRRTTYQEIAASGDKEYEEWKMMDPT